MDHCLTFGLEYSGLFYGIYKARVIDNQDPDNLGKLKVHCEQVHGDTYPDTWAWPVTPYAGAGFGFSAVPDKDELVWVAFDHGRPEFPIWLGGWWASGEPTPDMTPTNVVLMVKEGLKLVINRQDKSITILRDDNNSIVMDATGITIITDKDVTVNAQQNVKLNAQQNVNLVAQQNVNVQAQTVQVQAQSTEIDSSTIKMVGEVEIDGDLHVTGNTITDGTNSAHHIHPLNTLLGIAEPGA